MYTICGTTIMDSEGVRDISCQSQGSKCTVVQKTLEKRVELEGEEDSYMMSPDNKDAIHTKELFVLQYSLWSWQRKQIDKQERLYRH